MVRFFSKLSVIKLGSIVKWYGIAVFFAMAFAVVVFLVFTLLQISIALATALGFWGTLTVVVMVTGLSAFLVYKDEIFPDEDDDDFWERHMRNTMLHGKEYKAAEVKPETPYNFSHIANTQTWLKVEEAIAGMKDGETCDIHAPDGTVHHCADKAEALRVFNELWAARKTE